jgi:hypothetical protein
LATTLVGLAIRIAAKICAYTYALLVNRHLDRPQGRIKELWLEPDNRHLVGEVLFTEVLRIGILRTSSNRSSEKFGHEKSPRGNLSVGEDILPDRTVRLRRERGREPTEELETEEVGAGA